MSSPIKSLYNKLRRLWTEPILSWGLRLAISVCVPLIMGLFYSDLKSIFWIAMASQSLAYIELKGDFGNVLRISLSATIISILSCILGTISGQNIYILIILMFVIGFLSALFKNLGERGTGMSLSLYIFFIISSSNPVESTDELWQRVISIFIGCMWALVVAFVWFLVEKQAKTLRQSIASVFKEMSLLAYKGRQGYIEGDIFTPVRELYLQENKIRNALNLSIELFNNQKDSHTTQVYNIDQVRRIAGLLNIQLLEIIEVTQSLKLVRKQGNIELHIHSVLRVWEQIFEMLNVYVTNIKVQDKLLLQGRLVRLQSISAVIQEDISKNDIELSKLQYILHLSKRMSGLVEKLITIFSDNTEKRVYQAYSFNKTLTILHPKLFSNEFANFFSMDRSMLMYAIRVGIAVMIGCLIDNWIFNQYGYWIPFTSIIVAQPYIGATIKKGIDRCIGTLLGLIVGFLFFKLPHADVWNIVLLFITSIFSIYYLKTKYYSSTFFVTLSLLGLLSLSHVHSTEILEVRLISTIIGSIISILLAFLFISTWDVSMLPNHYKKAIKCSFDYWYKIPLFHKEPLNWMKFKRMSESSNAKLYESYTRWLTEPSLKKNRHLVARYFTKIAHLIRVTKEINNINTEWELHNHDNSDEIILLEYDTTIIWDLFINIFIKLGIEKDVDLHSIPKIITVNRSQEISLQKMVIELQSIENSFKTQVAFSTN